MKRNAQISANRKSVTSLHANLNHFPASLLVLAVSMMIASCSTTTDSNDFPVLTGPYLGQTPPDTVPELFAPGIVGTGMFTRDMAIHPDGNELFYCVAVGNYTYAEILHSKIENNRWTPPETIPFRAKGAHMNFEPAFSPDGSRLYFLSTRADGDEEPGDQDIWYVDRTETGWGEPVNPGEPINTDGGEFFPSITKDGYLYFTHNDKGSGLNQIFRAKITGDEFSAPELLPEQVNCGRNRFNAFVDPGHTFIIVPAVGMEDGYDNVDYYIVFRNADDRWSAPINMGAAINKDNTRGWSPYVSPDGKYFFFMANWSDKQPDPLTYDAIKKIYHSPRNGNADIYWMKAGFIGKLMEKAVFE